MKTLTGMLLKFCEFQSVNICPHVCQIRKREGCTSVTVVTEIRLAFVLFALFCMQCHLGHSMMNKEQSKLFLELLLRNLKSLLNIYFYFLK